MNETGVVYDKTLEQSKLQKRWRILDTDKEERGEG